MNLASDDSFGLRTNRFGFNLSGTAGQVVIVEGSTNLSTWLPLQTNTLGNGPFTSAIQAPARSRGGSIASG